ncbi:MAG: hypothetical protein ABR501_08770 [Pyrinomonadaceae bacterium]
MKYPVAVGVDGYYYVLQINEILNTWHLYFSSPTPIALYLMSAIGFLVGDTVLAIKIASVFFQVLLCVGVFGLLTTVGCSRWLGLVGATLTAFAGLHFHLISEFINNLAGIAFIVLCGCCVSKTIRTRGRRWIALALSFFVLAIFSHKSILPVAAMLFILLMVSHYLINGSQTRFHRVVALVIIAFVLVGPALIAVQPFFGLPPSLRDEVLKFPRLPFGSVALPEKLILMMTAPAVLFLASKLPKQVRSGIAPTMLCAVALWSLLITLNPFLAYDSGWMGIAVRLSALSYVQVAILFPGLVWMVMLVRPVATVYAAVVTAPLFWLSMNSELPPGMQQSYLADRAQIITNLKPLGTQLPSNSIVIAEHGTQFVVTFATGIRSISRIPQDSSTTTVYWLLVGIARPMLNEQMTHLAQSAHGSFVVLIKNDDLKARLVSMTEVEKRRVFGANRHLYQACVSGGLIDPSGQCQLP